jgi:predicted nucleotidyltransferase
MVKFSEIQEFAGMIAREFEPQKIVLFGSHSRGAASEESDVDLLVILSFRGKGCRKAVEILERLKPAFALDLLLRTPEQFEQRIQQGDFFLRKIAQEGVVLYENPHA